MNFKILASIVLFLFYSFQCNGQSSRLSEAISNSIPSVFLVKTFDKQGNNIGLGSGFFIDSLGTGITNYHVLQGAESANIYLYDGSEYSIRYVQGIDKQHDIIRFSIETGTSNERKTEFLNIADVPPSIGDDVFTIGNPNGLQFSASNGIISSVREDEEFGSVLQTTTPISKGSSGSPLINDDGEVVGVLSFYLAGGQNLNFAVSSKYIKQLNLDNIVFDFPEEKLNIYASNKHESILRKYDWGTTQYKVRSTEDALLISEEANLASSIPELKYLIKLFGRPFELTYKFESGKLSAISFYSIYKIDKDELIAYSPLLDAINIFQVLSGELSSILGDDFVCERGKLYEDKSSNDKFNCFSDLSEYSFRRYAKREFDAFEGKKYDPIDKYLYTIIWYIEDTTYALRIGLDMGSTSTLPKAEAFCLLSIYPKREE